MLNGRSRFVQTSPKWRQGQSTGTCLRGQPAHGCSSRRPCTKSILEAPDEHSDAPDHTPSKVGKLHPPPPERLKDRSQRPCPNRPRTDPPIEMTVRSADPQDYAALLTSSNRITIGRGQDDSHCVAATLSIFRRSTSTQVRGTDHHGFRAADGRHGGGNRGRCR